MRKLLSCVVLAGLLVGCSDKAASPVANAPAWEYEDWKRDDGSVSRVATIESIGSVGQNEELKEPQLVVWLSKDEDADSNNYTAMVITNGGEIDCVGSDRCVADIAFDGSKEFKYPVKSTDYTFFIGQGEGSKKADARRFVHDLKSSSKMTISIDMRLIGPRTFEFNTKDLNF